MKLLEAKAKLMKNWYGPYWLAFDHISSTLELVQASFVGLFKWIVIYLLAFFLSKGCFPPFNNEIDLLSRDFVTTKLQEMAPYLSQLAFMSMTRSCRWTLSVSRTVYGSPFQRTKYLSLSQDWVLFDQGLFHIHDNSVWKFKCTVICTMPRK